MTEKDESVKNNTETTKENEAIKNETSSSYDVENNNSEEELNNESTSEHDNEDKNDQSKDEEIQQLQLKANENEEKYLGACSYDCAKHERNRYVARHHISNEEWQRRLNNFKDVPEHTHA